MIVGGLDGRVCWLMSFPKAASGWLSGAAAGRERSEPALDSQTLAAYPQLMSQHIPPSRPIDHQPPAAESVQSRPLDPPPVARAPPPGTPRGSRPPPPFLHPFPLHVER